MPLVLAIALLAGTGGLLWRREHNPENALAVRGDAPVQLLQWAIGLLPADRVDWGEAMIGELDQIESRSQRWRFALGCVSGVVTLRPWRPIGPMAALVAIALSSAAVFGIAFVHYGLATNPWNWVMLAVLAALVMGSIVALSVLLRRPGLARLGLVGGLFVAATWLAFSRFTFAGVISPIHSAGAWSGPALMIAVPLIVGGGSALRSGSALVGRRTARLAGVSAGLVMFFVSTIAVVAIDGGQRDPGVGLAGSVSEAFSNVAMLFLVLLPLATAAIGWVGATATARIRHWDLARPNRDSVSAPKTAEPAHERSRSQGIAPGTLRAIVAIALVMAVIVFFLAR